MASQQKQNRWRRIAALGRYVPIVVIAATFAWSAAAIVKYRATVRPSDQTVIRIAHWQLEPGVRRAIDAMAKEYCELHPELNLRIEQEAIPEGVYGTYLTTSLIGGTAADLIEIGQGLPSNIWVTYLNRYFYPTTPYVHRPNPYNVGTELEGVPLRMTAIDGMRVAYQPELQEYMSFPLSGFGVRIFYNRDLLKKLTGLDTPPTHFREFKAVCDQIAAQHYAPGRAYVPIASSRFHLVFWEMFLADALTHSVLNRTDLNYDFETGNDEFFTAVATGRLSLKDPAIRARFELFRELADGFQRGWTGIGRDEAVFLFAQQRAVFIATGTWDAQGLVEQAEDAFALGVTDFPVPADDDPTYGRFMTGLLHESVAIGFGFGITRTSKHPEIARDFMLYLMSRRGNEKMNRIIGWLPIVKGGQAAPMLEDFRPRTEGTTRGLTSSYTYAIGGETNIRWQQLYTLYQVGKISYDELADQFTACVQTRGLDDFREQQRDWQRAAVSAERFLAGLRIQAITDTDPATAAASHIRYTNQAVQRQILAEAQWRRQRSLVDDPARAKAFADDPGVYAYDAHAIANLRIHATSAASSAEAAIP